MYECNTFGAKEAVKNNGLVTLQVTSNNSKVIIGDNAKVVVQPYCSSANVITPRLSAKVTKRT